jgi:cysteine desulfurase
MFELREHLQSALQAALPGIAVSAGAVCHSGEPSVSPVLIAMHVSAEFAAGTLRLSVGRSTTETEIGQAIEQIVAVLRGK